MAANNWIIDPKTTDFSPFKYTIGNNDFDSDMHVVGDFVRAHNNPKDKLAQSAVFSYYNFCILSYWNFTKTYIYSEDIAREYKEIYRQKETKTPPTKDELEIYEQEVMDFLDSLTENFLESKTYDIVMICQIFEYIATVACWNKPDLDTISERDYAVYGGITYPLPNKIGIFGLNTYLYGYFNGVYLIGVPTQVASCDFQRGCPLDFITHDLEHTDDIFRDTQEMPDEFNRYFYYTVLNDPELTMREKECHITNLWCLIHEASTEEHVRHGISLREINADSGRYLEEIVFTIPVTLLWDIYSKFDEFVLSDTNIDDLMGYFDEYEGYADIKNDITGTTTTAARGRIESDSDKVNYLYLAMWYTGRYVSDLYQIYFENQ